MARDNEYVICPHCGEEHGDAWEWCPQPEPKVLRCQSCDQQFQAWAEYDVQYVTAVQLPALKD